MVGRIIETDADVAEGAAWLAAVEPRFAAALALTGPLPLRRRPDGFATLFSAIVSQQVSTAAAAAIWGAARGDRAATSRPACSPRRDEALRAAGLSRQKIAYGRAHRRRRRSTSTRCAALPDAEVVAALTRIKGIGVWTAEIYAMFSLGPRRRLRAGRPGAAGGGGAAVRAAGAAARARAARDGRGLVAVAGGGGAAALGLLPGRRPVARGCGDCGEGSRVNGNLRCTLHAQHMHDACTGTGHSAERLTLGVAAHRALASAVASAGPNHRGRSIRAFQRRAGRRSNDPDCRGPSKLGQGARARHGEFVV